MCLSFFFQGVLFSTPGCLKIPPDLVKLYVHESSRVYRDKMVDEKDFGVFDKTQTEMVKKYYDVSDRATVQTLMKVKDPICMVDKEGTPIFPHAYI